MISDVYVYFLRFIGWSVDGTSVFGNSLRPLDFPFVVSRFCHFIESFGVLR